MGQAANAVILRVLGRCLLKQLFYMTVPEIYHSWLLLDFSAQFLYLEHLAYSIHPFPGLGAGLLCLLSISSSALLVTPSPPLWVTPVYSQAVLLGC